MASGSAELPHPLRRSAGRESETLCGGDLLVEVSENLLNHLWIFDAGNNPDGSAAGPTGVDVNAKNALEALYRNPVIVALLSGVSVNLLGVTLPKAVNSIAALPSGVIMYVFAQRYQVAIATATTIVLVYTVLSTITLSGLLLILASP